jgi:hypothetical protein
MVQVRRLPGPLSEGLPPARYPVSKTGGSSGLGGSTPSPSASLEAWPSWKGSALLARRRPSPLAGSSPAAPWSKRVMTPGLNPETAGRIPPGGTRSSSGCRGAGHPTGFGRRRSQVRLLPARLRGRGAAVLASLMSSRSWVRIPPALSAARSPSDFGRGPASDPASVSRARACRARRNAARMEERR